MTIALEPAAQLAGAGDAVSLSIWWHRLYPAAMLLFPAALTLFVRRHPSLAEEGHAAATARLWAATVAVLLVHVVVQTLFELGVIDRHGLLAGWSTTYPLLGFFLLWFGFAAKVLTRRDPGWRAPSPDALPVRTVSLEPRELAPTLPWGAWAAAWVVWAACVAVTAWVVATSLNLFPALGLLFFPGFAWGARHARSEPEPLDAAASDDVRQAWESLGRFKAWGFLLGGLAGSVVFAGGGLLMVWSPASAGLWGGIGGSLVGLAGGVFGTMGSVRRARIERLLAERAAGPDGAEEPGPAPLAEA